MNTSEPTVDAMALHIAARIAQSFWEMEGGEGPTPQEPSSGDLQLAHDIVTSAPFASILEDLQWRYVSENNSEDEAFDEMVDNDIDPVVIAWILDRPHPDLVDETETSP